MDVDEEPEVANGEGMGRASGEGAGCHNGDGLAVKKKKRGKKGGKAHNARDREARRAERASMEEAGEDATVDDMLKRSRKVIREITVQVLEG